MFQVKNFEQIVADAIVHMRLTQEKITDFRVGAVARTLVEAPAIELDEFYQRVLYGLLEAIPTAVYHAFDFDALPAATAGGKVRFSSTLPAASAVAIPIGTKVQRPDTRQRYVTTEAKSIASGGTYVDVRVAAEFAGAEGNAPVGELTLLLDYIAGIDAVTNLDPIIGGKDAETPEERKLRFVDYVGSLSRGTVWAIAYAAKSGVVADENGAILESVARIGISEGAGNVTVYIHGSLGTASTQLLDRVRETIEGEFDGNTQRWLPGYRPVGVSVVVLPMTSRTVDIALGVKMFDGYTLDVAVQNAIRDQLFSALSAVAPRGVLYVDKIAESALVVPGVWRVVVDATENILCGVNEVLALGVTTITALND